MTSPTTPHERLERLVAALELDLLEAPDSEVLAVTAELGVKPEMRGSAALIGVTNLLFRHMRAQPESSDVTAADHDAPLPRRGPRLPGN